MILSYERWLRAQYEYCKLCNEVDAGYKYLTDDRYRAKVSKLTHEIDAAWRDFIDR